MNTEDALSESLNSALKSYDSLDAECVEIRAHNRRLTERNAILVGALNADRRAFRLLSIITGTILLAAAAGWIAWWLKEGC